MLKLLMCASAAVALLGATEACAEPGTDCAQSQDAALQVAGCSALVTRSRAFSAVGVCA